MQVNEFVKIESGMVDKATFDQHVPAHQAYVRKLIAKDTETRTGTGLIERRQLHDEAKQLGS